ncbi:ROK family protein [Phreatobacter stygius]|uniref:ROK family protein n=1 Tax=Phreatobacter stygius TaxID=1940610 RepID=A0A4D7BCF5_9HYPH|nr:ROK family protein [Phreatobacter stygius]QCI68490.1 ROK family protein [Phreatobacter stygius]
MAKSEAKTRPAELTIGHGASELSSVSVDSYNLELRDKDGFIGDRASKRAFVDKLEDLRSRLQKVDADPIGDVATEDISKKQLDQHVMGKDAGAAALIHGAIEEFAGELAEVIRRFMRTKGWGGVERIAAGGGFKESRVGELAIARAKVILNAAGSEVDLQPIHHHPDEAGLIGAIHLVPAWMFAGHDAILAVDIGGSNIRVGVVKLNLKKAADLSEAEVWKSDLWRHADDSPSRTDAVKKLVKILKDHINQADKAELKLAPFIGIGCPGLIEPDGRIERGGQNLPGGNWESESFNLAAALIKAIPAIGDHETFVVIHNDAVVQGLAEVPFMQDVKTWGVVTIGTGLGNASFTNKAGK